MKKLYFYITYCFTSILFSPSFCQTTQRASVVIFSFDRPLQLHATLRSLEKYITDFNEIFILYRVTNEEYDKAYIDCFAECPMITKAYKQGEHPRADFKPLLLTILHACANDYVLLLVDDAIVIDTVTMNHCIQALETHDAYGFYLNLGMNILESYILKSPNPIPNHLKIDPFCTWLFQDGWGEWCYPNGVDRVIFKKQHLIDEFASIDFSSPNILEARWYERACYNGTFAKKGICYNQSKIINIPLTMVQKDWQTSYTTPMTSQECLDLFNTGKRIDIDQYAHKVPTAPHSDLPLFLINK